MSVERAQLWLVVPRRARARLLDAGGDVPFAIDEYERYAQRVAAQHGANTRRCAVAGSARDAFDLLVGMQRTATAITTTAPARTRWVLVALPRDLVEHATSCTTTAPTTSGGDAQAAQLARWAVDAQRAVDARVARRHNTAAAAAAAAAVAASASVPLLPMHVPTPAWGDREQPRSLATLVLWCERAWHIEQRRAYTLTMPMMNDAGNSNAKRSVVHAPQYVRAAVRRYASLYVATRLDGERLVRVWKDADMVSGGGGVSRTNRRWLADVDAELRVLRAQHWRDVGWASGPDGRRATAAIVDKRRAHAKRVRDEDEAGQYKRRRTECEYEALRALDHAVRTSPLHISAARVWQLRAASC